MRGAALFHGIGSIEFLWRRTHKRLIWSAFLQQLPNYAGHRLTALGRELAQAFVELFRQGEGYTDHVLYDKRCELRSEGSFH